MSRVLEGLQIEREKPGKSWYSDLESRFDILGSQKFHSDTTKLARATEPIDALGQSLQS